MGISKTIATTHIQHNSSFIHSQPYITKKSGCLWQRINYPSDKSQYNALAQKLKRTIANYRNESYTKHLESLTTKDGSLWKTTKHLRIRILHLYCETLIVIGYTLTRTKLAYLQTTSLKPFNLIIAFSFRKKLT